MRYPGDRHVLPLFGPWRWAPYMRGKFYWKKYQNARSFFLSHTSKLNQQKQLDVVPKSTAKIDPSNKYNIFPSFIIDQSWNTLQLKNIVLSFHPPFEPITALFTFTGLWPLEASLDYWYNGRLDKTVYPTTVYCISLVPCLSDSVFRVRLKSDEIENFNFMHICLPPLPPTCQDSNFICITRPYIPSTAHFNARQQISYKGMKHQPIIPSFTCSLFAVWH